MGNVRSKPVSRYRQVHNVSYSPEQGGHNAMLTDPRAQEMRLQRRLRSVPVGKKWVPFDRPDGLRDPDQGVARRPIFE